MKKKFKKKLTNKGEAIRYQMDKGMANTQISKTLGIPKSIIPYQRKMSNNLISKRSSKLQKNISLTKYLIKDFYISI